MKIMKDAKNTKNIKELAKINDEKAREEICRIVIKDFSKAKREFVATYCGQGKDFRLHKDAVTKLSMTFKKYAKTLILTDCPLQNLLFDAIANSNTGTEGVILYLMSCSVIPTNAQDVLEKDHSIEKMFSVAYGWQVAMCGHGLTQLIYADEKYNWHIGYDILVDISKPILG